MILENQPCSDIFCSHVDHRRSVPSQRYERICKRWEKGLFATPGLLSWHQIAKEKLAAARYRCINKHKAFFIIHFNHCNYRNFIYNNCFPSFSVSQFVCFKFSLIVFISLFWFHSLFRKDVHIPSTIVRACGAFVTCKNRSHAHLLVWWWSARVWESLRRGFVKRVRLASKPCLVNNAHLACACACACARVRVHARVVLCACVCARLCVRILTCI